MKTPSVSSDGGEGSIPMGWEAISVNCPSCKKVVLQNVRAQVPGVHLKLTIALLTLHLAHALLLHASVHVAVHVDLLHVALLLRLALLLHAVLHALLLLHALLRALLPMPLLAVHAQAARAQVHHLVHVAHRSDPRHDGLSGRSVRLLLAHARARGDAPVHRSLHGGVDCDVLLHAPARVVGGLHAGTGFGWVMGEM